MSADEESFIVLDETPSMLQYSILDASSLNDESIISNNSLYRTTTSSLATSNGIQADSKTNSIPNKLFETSKIGGTSYSTTAADLSRMTLNGNGHGNANGNGNSASKSPMSSCSSIQQPVLRGANDPIHSAKATLAQSFLLGAIDCETIKYNVKSYFPSLSSSTNTEDIEKLQSLIQERNELKDTLQKTNVTMRQQFSMVNNWHNNVKVLKDNHEDELKKIRNINDELNHQKNNLEQQVAELQQLAELSHKSKLQIEDSQANAQKHENDRLTEELDELKIELSNAIASKVELEEVHQEYVEKNAQLRVELIASQKMFKQSNEENQKLKEQLTVLQQSIVQANELAEKYREELGATQAQCEVYRNDFELERKAREEIASEREQMIADNLILKRRCQAVEVEAQSYYTETSAASLSSIPTNRSTDENGGTKICPICSAVYERFNDLESHVQSCLETAGYHQQ